MILQLETTKATPGVLAPASPSVACPISSQTSFKRKWVPLCCRCELTVPISFRVSHRLRGAQENRRQGRAGRRRARLPSVSAIRSGGRYRGSYGARQPPNCPLTPNRRQPSLSRLSSPRPFHPPQRLLVQTTNSKDEALSELAATKTELEKTQLALRAAQAERDQARAELSAQKARRTPQSRLLHLTRAVCCAELLAAREAARSGSDDKRFLDDWCVSALPVSTSQATSNVDRASLIADLRAIASDHPHGPPSVRAA